MLSWIKTTSWYNLQLEIVYLTHIWLIFNFSVISYAVPLLIFCDFSCNCDLSDLHSSLFVVPSLLSFCCISFFCLLYLFTVETEVTFIHVIMANRSVVLPSIEYIDMLAINCILVIIIEGSARRQRKSTFAAFQVGHCSFRWCVTHFAGSLSRQVEVPAKSYLKKRTYLVT